MIRSPFTVSSRTCRKKSRDAGLATHSPRFLPSSLARSPSSAATVTRVRPGGTAYPVQTGSVNRPRRKATPRVGVGRRTSGPRLKVDLKPIPRNPIVCSRRLLEYANRQRDAKCSSAKSSPSCSNVKRPPSSRTLTRVAPASSAFWSSSDTTCRGLCTWLNSWTQGAASSGSPSSWSHRSAALRRIGSKYTGAVCAGRRASVFVMGRIRSMEGHGGVAECTSWQIGLSQERRYCPKLRPDRAALNGTTVRVAGWRGPASQPGHTSRWSRRSPAPCRTGSGRTAARRRPLPRPRLSLERTRPACSGP